MAALVIRNESRRGRLVQSSIQIQRYRHALQLMSVGCSLSCAGQHAIHFSWWSCSRFATAPCRIVAHDSNCSSAVHDEASARVICACVPIATKMSGLSEVRSSAELSHTAFGHGDDAVVLGLCCHDGGGAGFGNLHQIIGNLHSGPVNLILPPFSVT